MKRINHIKSGCIYCRDGAASKGQSYLKTNNIINMNKNTQELIEALHLAIARLQFQMSLDVCILSCEYEFMIQVFKEADPLLKRYIDLKSSGVQSELTQAILEVEKITAGLRK